MYPEALELLRIVTDSPTPIDLDQLKLDEDMPDTGTIDEVNAQMFSVLMALTSDEPFDIVLNSGTGNGLEAWRRLQRRHDPSTVGRSRGLLRDILSLGKSSVENLRHNVEKLEEKFRRCCERRGSGGQPCYPTIWRRKCSYPEADLPLTRN